MRTARLGRLLVATMLALVSLLPVSARAEAADIPVLDVIAVSSYLVENPSYNDHLSPMSASEPRPSCYHGGTNSAWYRITTSIKGQMAVRLMDYRDTDIHSIALYRGTSFGDLAELGCYQFPPMGGFFPEPPVRPGDSLYFQVIADGPYWVSALVGPTRFIDNFADAEDLSVGFLNFGAWTTENATVEPGEPLPCGGALTAWLKYVPDQSGSVTFTMMDGLNDVLALYRGSTPAGLQLIRCGAVNNFQRSDLGSRVETRVTADLVKGVTYYVQIGATEGPGSFILPLVSRGSPPTNDSPGAAIALDDTHHSVNATTVGAFTRWLALNCGIWESVWYVVTPQSSGILEVTVDSKATGDFNFAPALAIHRADTGDLLACGADTSATVTQRASVTAGTSYLIDVMSAGHPGDFRMHWEVK
jgi:hypothetical protein